MVPPVLVARAAAAIANARGARRGAPPITNVLTILDSVVDCAFCGLSGEHTPECLLITMSAAIAKAEEPS
jgi:hypothetical protein